MTGSIKDYTPNFEFIIPEFNITGWHDYLEENFRSIDALFYNLFGINNFKGQWKNSTAYNVDDVVFIGEDTDYSGRLVKVLVQHTTAGTGNFTEFFTANPSYYELFADASTAQLFAQKAKDWAVKLDGPIEDDLYSSKFYANIVNSLSTEITTLYNIRSDIQNVSLIGTEVVNVSNIKNSVQTVASMQSDINDVVAIKSDIEWIADNDTIVTNVSNNSTKITTVANNISSVNTTATNITDINTVAGISSNVTSVAGNSTNINSVANNITNIVNVANNSTNINTVATNVSDINTNATNINAINTNASNISVIQNASTYATNAQNSATSAQNYANKAQEWAISENIVDNTDYSAKHYAEVASQHENPLRIGQIIESTIPLNDAGLHLLDGSLIQGNGIYSEFVDFIKNLHQSDPNGSWITDENGWQSSVNQYGVCGKFAIDYPNNTVRLPKISGFIEGTNDLTVLGDLVEAGLPNMTGGFKIQGNARISWGNSDLILGTGVFKTRLYGSDDNRANQDVATGQEARTSEQTDYVDFNASRSSSIYGNSSTVQPQSIKVLYYIVIATSTKTDIQVDIDEIATDLNNKLDKNDLAPVHCVVETYLNGKSWYRVYDDGWIEQGGIGINAAGTTQTTVTFIKPFTNVNSYKFFAQHFGGSNASATMTHEQATTTNIKINYSQAYSGGARAFDWIAFGY